MNFPEGTDLSKWQAKVNLINRDIDECPEPGWVAIVDTRDWQPEGSKVGHVGYVKNADENSGIITVVTLDAGWNGKVARRTGTPAKLKIKGYYEP